MAEQIFIGVVSGLICSLVTFLAKLRFAPAAKRAVDATVPRAPAVDAPTPESGSEVPLPPPGPAAGATPLPAPNVAAPRGGAGSAHPLLDVLGRANPLYAAIGGFFGYLVGRFVSGLFFSERISGCAFSPSDPSACYEWTGIGLVVVVLFVIVGAGIGASQD